MYDRTVKLPRYANSGVTEVWIENSKRICFSSFVTAGGAYQTCLILRPGDSLSVAAFPDVVFKVEDFLG